MSAKRRKKAAKPRKAATTPIYGIVQLDWFPYPPPMNARVLHWQIEQQREGTFFHLYDNIEPGKVSKQIICIPGPLIQCTLKAVGMNGKISEPATTGFRLTPEDLDAELPLPQPTGFVWRLVGVTDKDEGEA